MDEISAPVYEFEGFRFDTTLQVIVSPAGEPIPLPSRAFETLRHLVERAGELVERPALMRAVWPRAIVEDNNLTQCILTLRRAFGEEAGERRFILTVPGRGFKFVAPVRVVPRMRQRSVETPPPPPPDLGVLEPAPAPPAATQAATRRTDQHWARRHWTAIAVAPSLLVATIFAAWLVLRTPPPPTSPAEYAPLTDVTDSATAPVLSPEGHFLAFIRGGAPFLSSGQVWLKQLPDGELVQLTHASGPIFAPTFTADGTRLAYTVVGNSSSWDTWTVPITGGEPTRLLPNASGLTFIGAHEVMYSEFKTGIHLGIVTSRDDRSGHRDIYLPSHERAMAHFAYLSPDRKSVLVVEMGRSADWQRCRLVPFDGSSTGEPVGPSGACVSAAWSPDGKWMYFAAYADHHSHLWRQSFPDGVPQQLTFGPTDEETVAASPGGRSLLTSLGQARSELWLHDASGERALTTVGAVSTPWLSADARRVYFLTIRNSLEPWSLARLDIASGRREPMLPGFVVDGYDISHDERQVVFTTTRGGASEIWIAPLDRHEPPRLLVRGGDEVAFDREGRVYFRQLGESVNYLHRVRPDGQRDERVLDAPMLEFNAVSPDGNWVVVDLPTADSLAGAFLAPVHGGAPRLITDGWWPSRWSRDGKMLYLEVGEADNSRREGRTAVLPFGADGSSIDFARPTSAAAALIPHSEQELSVGSDPSEYVYVRRENRRNIYRIPVH